MLNGAPVSHGDSMAPLTLGIEITLAFAVTDGNAAPPRLTAGLGGQSRRRAG
jgi:hypothetical protein